MIEVTALVSVLASFVVAIFSLWTGTRDKKVAREHEFALSLLPRRLDAFETAWRALYELEQDGEVSETDLNLLIAGSLWLPEEVRDSTVRIAATKNPDSAELSRLRKQLAVKSGSRRMNTFLS
jgi:hypothetical protein